MKLEVCRNEQEYTRIYDRLISAVRGMCPEETLRLAHIAYAYVFDNINGREEELEMLSELIDSRHDQMDLSRKVDKLMVLLGEQTQ